MPIRNEYKVHSLAAAKRAKAPKRQAQTMQVILPEMAVWKEAKRRARGDTGRLQVIARNTVIVWNSPEQKRALMGKVAV